MIVSSQIVLTLIKNTVLLEKICDIVIEDFSLKLLHKSVSRSQNMTMNHY